MRKPELVVYGRVSTKIKIEGSGKAQQINRDKINSVADELGLPVCDEVYFDEGKSAFTLKHLEGRFGDLMMDISKGKIAQGSVIYLFSLDRLSRAGVVSGVSILTNLINSGVSVYSSIDGKLYDENSSVDIIFSVIEFMRSYSESKTKSDRTIGRDLSVIKAVNRNSEGIHEMLGMANLPWWLEISKEVVNEKTRKFAKAKHPHFAAAKYAVECITALYSNKVTLAKVHEKFPSIVEDVTYSKITVLWKRTQLYGEQEVTLDGVKYTLTGYCPSVCTKDEFYKLKNRKSCFKTTSTFKEINPLSAIGVLRCGVCNLSLSGSKSKGEHRLHCEGAKRGICSKSTFKSLFVEDSVIRMALLKIWQPSDEVSDERLAIEGQLQHVSEKLKITEELQEEAPTRAGAKLIGKLEQEEDSLQERLQAVLTGDSVSPSSDWELLPESVLDQSDNENRMKLRLMVKDSISEIKLTRLPPLLMKKRSISFTIEITFKDGEVMMATRHGRKLLHFHTNIRDNWDQRLTAVTWGQSGFGEANEMLITDEIGVMELVDDES